MGTATVSEKILKMTIKGKWYDLIMALEKSEEYREIKPYWTVRLQNAGLLDKEGAVVAGVIGQALLQNGYGPRARRMHIRFLLRKGRGPPGMGSGAGGGVLYPLRDHKIGGGVMLKKGREDHF